MKIYRKIWESYNGPIPKDEFGKSFQIHHLDGNRYNNDISNLMCLSAEDHIALHRSQGDFLNPPKKKKEHNKPKLICPHCGYVGSSRSRIYDIYHGDNCIHSIK